MISDANRDTLEALARSIADTESQLAAQIAERDYAIRLALAAGGKPTEVGRIFGLGRERIYQIKDHRNR